MKAIRAEDVDIALRADVRKRDLFATQLLEQGTSDRHGVAIRAEFREAVQYLGLLNAEAAGNRSRSGHRPSLIEGET